MIAALRALRDVDAEVVEITTSGDADQTRPFEEIGPKGIFAVELQRALLDDRIDIAVHSLKDLVAAEPDGLVIAVTPPREDPRDVLVSREGLDVRSLPAGAVVGTSSVRREALIRMTRPDLATAPLRGNVDTRLRKVADGEVDAAILAAAGIVRLGRAAEITEWLDPMTFVPPPGQGAIAVEVKGDRFSSDLSWIIGAQDEATRACVDAERAFMMAMEGSCEVPLGGWARHEDGGLVLEGFVASRDGSDYLRDAVRGTDPRVIGASLAKRMLDAGAADLVRRPMPPPANASS